MRRTSYPVAALAAVVLLGSPDPAAAQEEDVSGSAAAQARTDAPVRQARVPRVEEGPTIDGRPDDAVWQATEPLTRFIQRTPWDGRPASQQTEVRVVHDADAVYVGVWAYDTDPSRIVEGESLRDYDLENSDAVLLIFDTFDDEENGFVFGTNPAGIEYDGQVVNQGEGGGRFSGGALTGQRQQSGSGGGFNLNWDASWTVATSRDDGGWYAEFRIPFSTLRYGPGEEQAWGFNVARRVRRENEESFWSPVPREFNLYRVSRAGTLTGLHPPARRSVRLTPYVLGSTSRDYLGGESGFDEEGELGGDAKVQITQSLTLDVTYNTDFAQVEVDDVQTNLTRFSLFFPEKRPFFLENAGYFSVGASEAELFFSRRIGISPDGAQVPIQGGGRLSGRALGLNVGLLHIRTDGLQGIQPGNAFSVARVEKEWASRSSVGGIFVERDALDTEGDHNRTYAVDGQLGLGDALTLRAFGARTETPGLDPDDPDRVVDDEAFEVSASWSSRSLRGSADIRQVGHDFNPEVGFLPRDGYRQYSIFGMWYYRPAEFLGVREFRPHVRYQTYRDLTTGFQETSQVHVDSHVEWHSGHFFSPAFNWVREGLEEPFEIAEGIVVPPGTYDGWEAAWHAYTNQAADLAFETRINWGSFLSGDRRGVSTLFTLRQGSKLSTALRFEYNDVSLAEGDFTTRLTGLRLGYFFTPRIYIQSLVQYSDQIDRFSANVRFAWLHTAGTGLFIVYNGTRGVDALDGPLNRSFTVKYSRQFTLWGG